MFISMIKIMSEYICHNIFMNFQKSFKFNIFLKKEIIWCLSIEES